MSLSGTAESQAKEERLVALLTGAFFIGVMAVLSAPLLSKASWMIFVQDDLIYYLIVAQNIARHLGSTFNHVVPTNGYQPLWLIILVGFSYFTESPKALLAF